MQQHHPFVYSVGCSAGHRERLVSKSQHCEAERDAHVHSHVERGPDGLDDVAALIAVPKLCLPAPAFCLARVTILQLLECEVWEARH